MVRFRSGPISVIASDLRRTEAVLRIRHLTSQLEYRLLDESEYKELAELLLYIHGDKAPQVAREIPFPNWKKTQA